MNGMLTGIRMTCEFASFICGSKFDVLDWSTFNHRYGRRAGESVWCNHGLCLTALIRN